MLHLWTNIFRLLSGELNRGLKASFTLHKAFAGGGLFLWSKFLGLLQQGFLWHGFLQHGFLQQGFLQLLQHFSSFSQFSKNQKGDLRQPKHACSHVLTSLVHWLSCKSLFCWSRSAQVGASWRKAMQTRASQRRPMQISVGN